MSADMYIVNMNFVHQIFLIFFQRPCPCSSAFIIDSRHSVAIFGHFKGCVIFLSRVSEKKQKNSPKMMFLLIKIYRLLFPFNLSFLRLYFYLFSKHS